MFILVLEDHKPIRDMLKMALVRDGHEVLEAEDVSAAKSIITSAEPDLAIVDWMLPGTSGVDFIRWIRRQKDIQHIPVIMLTARSEESDTITGLDAGADDYMSKPVAIRELLARIRALGRRPGTVKADAHLLEAGPVQVDTRRHDVRINGEHADIRQTEYKLLCFFLKHPDRVWSRSQILDRVWGRSAYLDERTVDVHILRLRKALKPFGADTLLKTVRGAGYRFIPQAESREA